MGTFPEKKKIVIEEIKEEIKCIWHLSSLYTYYLVEMKSGYEHKQSNRRATPIACLIWGGQIMLPARAPYILFE